MKELEGSKVGNTASCGKYSMREDREPCRAGPRDTVNVCEMLPRIDPRAIPEHFLRMGLIYHDAMKAQKNKLTSMIAIAVIQGHPSGAAMKHS